MSQNACKPWGQHLVLDLAGCPRTLVSDREHLAHWIVNLVDAIDMRRFGEAIIEHFAEHNPDAAGYTVVQLIETSNICAHFAENRGEAYIDIFSCKAFDNDIAEKTCRDFFKPTEIRTQVLLRGEFPQSLARAG